MNISKRITRRALVVLGVFILLWILLSVVLFKLQILSYDYYQNLVIQQMTKETTVTASRGSIYDTNMNLLAGNKTVWLIVISPQDIIDAMEEAEKAKAAAAAAAANTTGSTDTGNEIEVDREKFGEYEYTGPDGKTEVLPMNKLIARALSDILGVDYNRVIELAAKNGRYYEVIKKNVEKEDADKVRAFIDKYGLEDQIYLKASTKRYYPNGSLASHVIGFCNADGVGVYGIEAYYNSVLEGSSGTYITARNGRGGDLPYEYETYIEAQDGYSIVTTIDSYIQYELENVLLETMTENNAQNRVAGIVMDVNTGAILAMATLGGFDLNKPYELTDYYQNLLDEKGLVEGTDEYNKAYFDILYGMWTNKAVTELYEPGSTFKIITTSIALETNTSKLTDKFTCTGSLKVGGFNISCHKTIGHGTLNFAEALQQSCNPALMTIAARIGREDFYKYYKMFGYGEKTGIDLPGEAKTYYHSFSNFSDVSLAVYAFGQTFKVTPIQHLMAISAVANGGYLVTPHIMREIIDSDGNVIQSYEPNVVRQVISADVSKKISAILEEGVSGSGGAKNAYVAGYKVAAKTGTSQKRDKLDEHGQDTLRVSSCVAYAPADNPQVAVLILVDEPSNGVVYGSLVAAPYVSKLLSFVLPYICIEPQYAESEEASIEKTISNYVGMDIEAAKAAAQAAELEYIVVGDGSEVVAQSPSSGTIVSKISKLVVLYTGTEEPKNTVEVPDVVGKTAEAANRLIINKKLNIRIAGAANYASGSGATVVSQSPAAGTFVPEGTVITVEFMHLSDISD